MKASIKVIAFAFLFIHLSLFAQKRTLSDPAEVFRNPPESAKPGVLWMWRDSNLSKDGITKDLKRLGMDFGMYNGVGFECDKMSQEAIDFHMDHVIGEIQKHLGYLIGTGFSHVHFDSYEAGIPTWTPLMREEFKNRRGYDLMPYLLTFAGREIGDSTGTMKLKKEGNQLEIHITNVWANRLIGDEQEQDDCQWLPGHQGGRFLKAFPTWFMRNEPRPSKGRYCFTTWNYFTKNSALESSGLMGPVRISRCAF